MGLLFFISIASKARNFCVCRELNVARTVVTKGETKMKLNVNNNFLPVTIIRLHLSSTDARFDCVIPPRMADIFSNYLAEPNTAQIRFRDTAEIDNFIKLLERFKYECCDQMGVWKKSDERKGE